MFSVPIRSGWKWHASRSAQYDVLCIHCATCEVILMCTLHADSGLRAKPRPLRTLFSVHERSYLFWMCTKGAICSENGVYREHVPRTCSRWNCTENKYERPVRFPFFPKFSWFWHPFHVTPVTRSPLKKYTLFPCISSPWSGTASNGNDPHLWLKLSSGRQFNSCWFLAAGSSWANH